MRNLDRLLLAVTVSAIAIAAVGCDNADPDEASSGVPWSYLSGSIAYSGKDAQGDFVRILDANTRTVRRVTMNDPDLDANGYAGLTWSADGRAFYFHGFRRLPGFHIVPPRTRIVRMADDGSQVSVLFDSDPKSMRIICCPSVAADGRLAYVVDGHLWIDDVEMPVWRLGTTRPSWSPDGRTLAISQHGYGPDWDLRVFDTETGEMRILDGGMFTSIQDVAFAPDGTRIAYTKASHPGPAAVWVVNVDGSGAHQVIPGSQPAWSPDGRLIIFRRPDGRLHLIAAAGGPTVALTRGRAWTPTWRP